MATVKRGLKTPSAGLLFWFIIVPIFGICMFFWKPVQAKLKENDIQEIGSIDGITVYKVTVDGIPYIMNSQGGIVRHKQ